MALTPVLDYKLSESDVRYVDDVTRRLAEALELTVGMSGREAVRQLHDQSIAAFAYVEERSKGRHALQPHRPWYLLRNEALCGFKHTGQLRRLAFCNHEIVP